jgi:RNA polymerase sigma-70 factor (ECF subfamily)
MVNVVLLPSAAPDPPPPAADDGLRALVAAASAGDAAAARRVLERAAPSVHRVVRTVLGPSGRHGAQVEDVTQDTLVALVHALGAFRGECSFVHYACRIAARVAVAARRARAAEAHLEPLEAEGALDIAQDGGFAGDDPEAPRRRALVRALLDELPEAQAETLVLRVMLGYSMTEVAQATGAKINTVRSRLRLAKEALKSRIEQDQALAEMLEVG